LRGGAGDCFGIAGLSRRGRPVLHLSSMETRRLLHAPQKHVTRSCDHSYVIHCLIGKFYKECALKLMQQIQKIMVTVFIDGDIAQVIAEYLIE
jgi:hypothetical protein